MDDGNVPLPGQGPLTTVGGMGLLLAEEDKKTAALIAKALKAEGVAVEYVLKKVK